MIEENKIKNNIAKNIIFYRKKNNMTQLDLANALSYSDKAVSKWERGVAIPDLIVLIRISELFNISLNDLIGDEIETNISDESIDDERAKYLKSKHKIITALSVGLTWLVAAILFFIFKMIFRNSPDMFYLFFVYAVPTSFIVWLVFNLIWGNPKHTVYIESLLSWTLSGAIIVNLYPSLDDPQLLFILIIPGVLQILIILWNLLLKRRREAKKKRIKE
ncbi:MAG: helix-turn-helix domain-containing protein [Gammaproteobacteria bacterium]|nr:helix-turn-helix domain-containing protein [Gammaproteobacteria bacterium]